jgi:N-acyl-D-aspartate/D-glutamate deacylase
VEKPREERLALFRSKEFRDELRAISAGNRFVAALGPGWEQIFLRLSPRPEHQAHLDASVADIAALRGCDEVDTLLDLALESDLGCQYGIPIMNYDEAVVGRLLRHPAGIIALSDAGAHVDTLADQGFTTSLLSQWVRDRAAFSLEEAVRLVTSVPAALYGIADRGEIREGWAADLVLFDVGAIGLERTEMVSDLPGGAQRLIQRPVGIHHVLVNGEPIVDGGRQTEARSGRVLRGGRA